MLRQAKASPDIDNYLAYLFVSSSAPPSVNLDVTNYYSARAAAAVMLKNDIKTAYKSIPESTKAYIRSTILLGLQDPALQMRNYAGNVITEFVRQGGIMGWPSVLSQLSELVSNSTGNISPQAQEGGMSALLKICEDNKRALDREYEGQKPLNFIFPQLISFTKSPLPKVRADAVASLNVFIPDKPEAVMANLDLVLQQLFQLASDASEDVRKHVCRAFVHICDVAPEKIRPHMAGLVDYVVTQQRNMENSELALDAAEFWLCVGEDEGLRDELGPHLEKIVPVLLASMVYDEDEVVRLEGDAEDAELEDREQDIKPTFATAKAGRLTTGANGEVGLANGVASSFEAYEDDDLSDGEIDDWDDDDDSLADPEEQWNLRKCSAAALDVLASVFHEQVFQVTLPYLKQNLSHPEWPNREAAVLALGAIADGCMSAVEPHLPELTDYLITCLRDKEPVVRQITCWTLGRYSGWAAALDQQGKQKYFVPIIEGILTRMLDNNKRVQEAAASAFANLEEKANIQLKGFCTVIVLRFVECFAKYKDRNMFILYDCVQTLAEHVGQELEQQRLDKILMPALMGRWNRVSDQSREMFPLLECLSYVATALGKSFTEYAHPIFTRCTQIIHRNLEQTILASSRPGIEPPDKDFLVTSLDLLSAIIQALPEPESTALVDNTRPNIFDLLQYCMQDPNNDVRQSAYALLGDCAIYLFPRLQPRLPQILEILINQLDISESRRTSDETIYSVINNACWSVGEISMRQVEGMAPYAGKLLEKLGTILFDEKVPESLNENAAIALGRLGMGCPAALSPHLAQLAAPFIKAIRKVLWTDEKAHALIGFMNIILKNPTAMEQSLQEFFAEMAGADRSIVIGGPGDERQVFRNTFIEVRWLRPIFRLFVVCRSANIHRLKILERYRALIPDFDAFLHTLPPPREQQLRALYLSP